MSDTTFRYLPLGAGGFVTGTAFSDDGGTRLLRTDGNGWRWDPSAGRWILNVGVDSMPDDIDLTKGNGVEALAVAPSDGSRAYMATRGALFRSDDAGVTWATIRTGVTTAPNDDFRVFGPRLAVDPSNPDVVYHGTRKDGLQYSRDGGTTWAAAASVPIGLAYDVADNVGNDWKRTTYTDTGVSYAAGGIPVVRVDRTSAVSGGRHQVVYAASYGQGLWRSADGGDTWTDIAPVGMGGIYSLSVAPNGDLITGENIDPAFGLDTPIRMRRWTSATATWSTITLTGRPNDYYSSIAVDPVTAGRIIIVGRGGEVLMSTNYGGTWTNPDHTVNSTGDVPWLAWALTNPDTGHVGYMSTAELRFDPVVPGRVWLCEGTGLWYADLTESTSPIKWHSRSRGIEHLVGNVIVAPPGGEPVVGSWDRAIFHLETTDAYPTQYGPTRAFNSCWDLDWSLSDSNYIVATVASQNDPAGSIPLSGVSTDGGTTWTPFATRPPDPVPSGYWAFGGAIACSAPGNVVWVSAQARQPYYTKDGGATWAPVVLPGVSTYGDIYPGQYFLSRHPVASDKQTAGTFYLFHASQGLFRTTDGGDNWTQMCTASAFPTLSYWQFGTHLKAAPSTAGLLYITPGNISGVTSVAMKRSVDGGATWTNTTITGCVSFGLGKPLTGSVYDTLYAVGYVAGIYGVYRSADRGATWTYLTDYPAGFIGTPKYITGDLDVEGRFYMTTGSAGFAVGDLVGAGGDTDQGVVKNIYIGATLVAYGTKAVDDALAGKADLSGGKLLPGQVPDIALTNIYQPADQAAMLALNVQKGDVARLLDGGGTFMLGGGGDATVLADWVPMNTPSTAYGRTILAAADAAAARTALVLGTSATANIPASGDAASGEVVKGSDTRLANTRTPTAHASTHAPGGSDDLTTALSAVSVPVALGTAATGTGTGFSRQGHVHPTTGLALTANNLSDLASAATARTNLGILKQTTVGSAATLTPTGDALRNDLFVTALATNPTIAAPTGTPADGNRVFMRIKGAASQTLTWNAIYQGSGVAPTLLAATVAGKAHSVEFCYDSALSKYVQLAVDATGY